MAVTYRKYWTEDDKAIASVQTHHKLYFPGLFISTDFISNSPFQEVLDLQISSPVCLDFLLPSYVRKLKLGYKYIVCYLTLKNFVFKSAVCSVPTLHCRELFACDPSLAPSNRVTTNWLLTVFTTTESREAPANLSRLAMLGTNPQGGWIFQQAELGAVLGAAGAIANTSALPSAPAEAADVPQTLSRMQRLIPLLIQINTPAHPLCPLPEDFRLTVPQSLFVFLF